jgi:hypothetical protein
MISKTRRRPVDISGSVPVDPTTPSSPSLLGSHLGTVNDRSDQFIQFLATNAEDAFTRPWHRLERGRRLNRLRKFVEEEAVRFQFTETEQAAMFQMLEKTLDKKQLNSKSIVTYDTEQQKILEIKGLVFHKLADGSIIFKITERKANTLRKSKGTVPSKAAVSQVSSESVQSVEPKQSASTT